MIEIGRHDASALGKARSDGARKDAGAGSRLQQVLRLGAGDPVGEIARVGFEDQRDEEPLVKRGNRPANSLSVATMVFSLGAPRG